MIETLIELTDRVLHEAELEKRQVLALSIECATGHCDECEGTTRTTAKCGCFHHRRMQ